MTPTTEPTVPAPLSQAEFQGLLHDKLRSAIWLTLTTILDEEVTAFIGAPRYGRISTRRDQRNGYYPRDLVTIAGKVEQLPVPRTRGGFRTRSSSVTNAGRRNWIRPSVRCSSLVPALRGWAKSSRP